MTLFLKCDSYKFFQSVVCVLHEYMFLYFPKVQIQNLVARVSGWGVMVLTALSQTPLLVWRGTPTPPPPPQCTRPSTKSCIRPWLVYCIEAHLFIDSALVSHNQYSYMYACIRDVELVPKHTYSPSCVWLETSQHHGTHTN